MNERGFFTIIGLCLLLIAAISIKGVHEFETNYSNGVTNFQIENKLQNLAESYLTEEFENISTLNDGENYSNSRNLGDYNGLKNCSVQIRAKNLHLKKFIRVYSSGSNYTDQNAGELPYKVKVIISVASCDSPFIIGKMYRRSFAYVDENNTVHYLNNL